MVHLLAVDFISAQGEILLFRCGHRPPTVDNAEDEETSTTATAVPLGISEKTETVANPAS